MKKIFIIFISVFLVTALQGQEKNKKEQQEKKPPKTAQTGEIKLDDLHLEALIEKPSVSIVPKRIEPDLEKVEFISRKFDQELKMVPELLFNMQLQKNKVEKIRDIEKILRKKRD